MALSALNIIYSVSKYLLSVLMLRVRVYFKRVQHLRSPVLVRPRLRLSAYTPSSEQIPRPRSCRNNRLVCSHIRIVEAATSSYLP